ncbi:hypothetical protein MJO28_002093 [Puccinia striiformis f. sp. tritici]|uniref:Uncharacterized protein n=1 Tax=Puccinia striiformis f. sp. tritici TaxID=168172 RepID=A0ACC0EV29_9BASI|nr:hypothetical protein Pst134EA_002675 [Puccinia striiformis f. sp. tritici]KAH9472047.1 hypothetical protein Pst134EA_002675 [Puccinia striiformis f. sp. tritici]KAI7961604.1 hypothetical protein MJO28_002093 [Puccinia striiformis f. sp. tritici]KAI7966419.1 hypothetical protein MJO29_002167 [Puccinia striiformis f. sp. tritici]
MPNKNIEVLKFDHMLPVSGQPQGPRSSCFHLRPRDATLLSLAPAVQAEPPALTLSKLPKPSQRPFRDIIPDARLDCWNRSTHVYPAAYPRSLSGSSVYEPVIPTYPKTRSAKAIVDEIRNQNSNAQRRLEGSHVDEPQLFIAVARYFITTELEENEDVSIDGDRPVTWILLHANGLHKETWEPTLAHLLLSPAGKKVQEVWAIDGAQSGDSAILNRLYLGLNVDGADYARDVLSLILSYLPVQSSRPTTIPVVLPRLECPDNSLVRLDKSTPVKRQSIHWRNRKLGLIGHSMGGTVAALVATSIPELFHHVILLDPVMSPLENFNLHLQHYVFGAVARRDKWESSDVALERFKGHQASLGLWDPHVLRRYVHYALESDEIAKLKCNKLHEASSATESHSRIPQSYHRLDDHYRENQKPPFKLLLILAKPSQSTCPDQAQEHDSFLNKYNLTLRVPSLGHLMVQENPRDVASLISHFLLNPISSSSFKDKSQTFNSKL